MTPAQRAERVRQLNRFAPDLAIADVRRRDPYADERERLLRVAARRLDPELLRKAVGRDPTQKG